MPKDKEHCTSVENIDLKFVVTKQNTDHSIILWYLKLRPVRSKIHHFAECSPEKCFNSFLQLAGAVDARRQGDENFTSSIVAETLG